MHSVSAYVDTKEVEEEDRDNDKEPSNDPQTADPLAVDLRQAIIITLTKCVGIDVVIK